MSASVTPRDDTHQEMYLFYRNLLKTIWTLYDTHPHIASHTIVKIRPAHPVHDYRFEPKFKDFAIVVEVTFKKRGCQTCRCNPKYPRSKTCTAYDSLQTFKSGNSTITACEPICNHLDPNAGPSKNVDSINTPFMNWNERTKTCLYSNILFNTWGTDDSTRDTTSRSYVTNIGTGLDTTTYTDTSGFQTDSFGINKFYCDHLNMDFAEGRCVQSKAHTFFEYVLSDTLYRVGDVLKNLILTGKTPLDVGEPDVGAVDMGQVPAFLQSISAWRNNIDHKFIRVSPFVKLSELGFREDNWSSHLWTTEVLNPITGNYGALVDPKKFYPKSDFYNRDVDQVAMRWYKLDARGFRNVHPDRDYMDIERRQTAMRPQTRESNDTTANKAKDLVTPKVLTPPPPPRPPTKPLTNGNDGQKFDIRAILDSIFSESTLVSLAASGTFNTASRELSHILLTVSNKLIPSIANVVLHQLQRTNLRVLQVVLRQMVVRQIAISLTQISARTAMVLAQMGSKALSGVGVVLIIFNVLDLLVLFKDPFNRGQYITPESIEQLALAMLETNEKLFGRRQFELTPFILQTLFWRIPQNLDTKITVETDFLGSVSTPNDMEKSISSEIKFRMAAGGNTTGTNGGTSDAGTGENVAATDKSGDDTTIIVDPDIDFFNSLLQQPISMDLFLASHYLLSLDTNSDGVPFDWAEKKTLRTSEYFDFSSNVESVQDIFDDLMLENLQNQTELENFTSAAFSRRTKTKGLTYITGFLFLIFSVLALCHASMLLVFAVMCCTMVSLVMTNLTIYSD